jgi:hypothetical protein
MCAVAAAKFSRPESICEGNGDPAGGANDRKFRAFFRSFPDIGRILIIDAINTA